MPDQAHDPWSWPETGELGWLKEFELRLAAAYGATYHEIVDDPQKREAQLHEAEPKYRLLALHLYRNGASLTRSAHERIFAMARSDPSDDVRCSALLALGTLPPGPIPNAVMRLYAEIALDEDESERVRRTAYQSALLLERDIKKTVHVFRLKKWSSADLLPCDFDAEFLKSALTGL
jgi:hypothetical protein